MIAIIFSLPLISLIITVGVVFPWLGLRLELMHRSEQRNHLMLEAQARVIDDQQATINAYRELVSTDSSFSLTSQ
jgi:hypothetical protein